MAKRLDRKTALFLLERTASEIGNIKTGANIPARTGYTVEQIISRVVLDRLTFAQKHLKSADQLLSMTKPDYRAATARAYYALYHAFRAVAYFYYQGDDHEKHSVLADKIPSDFPNSANWKNKLKSARLDRNRADYEPYPNDQKQFKPMADRIIADAKDLVPIAKRYLRSKGCL